MNGTPFIALQEPTKLDGYDRSQHRDQQPSHIPKTFCDAMEVREAVFVEEQGVPQKIEHDQDDARSCHWVMYASVQDRQPEKLDSQTGEVIQPRKSKTRSTPIGTMRIVPFPHPPHPHPGGRYVAGVLQKDDLPNAKAKPLSDVDEARLSAPLPYGHDRATTFHDGKEPYVKFGRMSVAPEFRGHKVSSQLWVAAKKWLENHPRYFDPSVTEMGMDQLKAGAPSDIPKWNGLVCCHARDSEQVVKAYEKWGFQVDEGMGKWVEDGFPVVGMFLRLNVKKDIPTI